MRFLAGMIFGSLLMVLCVAAYDASPAGAVQPLVNWSNVADLRASTTEYVVAHSDRFVKYLTSQY
jgi:hypothetical protein